MQGLGRHGCKIERRTKADKINRYMYSLSFQVTLWGIGTRAAQRLTKVSRKCNILACEIGCPKRINIQFPLTSVVIYRASVIGRRIFPSGFGAFLPIRSLAPWSVDRWPSPCRPVASSEVSTFHL